MRHEQAFFFSYSFFRDVDGYINSLNEVEAFFFWEKIFEELLFDMVFV